MPRDERENRAFSEGFLAGRLEAQKEMRQDWKAYVADLVLTGVDNETIEAWQIEVRNMHRIIKWLIEHKEELNHTWLRFPAHEERDVAITTLDAVQDWLEDMGGVLGAQGWEEEEENGNQD